MAPRDSQAFHGEKQPLMATPTTNSVPADGHGAITSSGQFTLFWQAVQDRRECSNYGASSGASALARRQRSKWMAIGFGQVVALIAASVNCTSFTLENNLGIIAPTFQLFLMYILLTSHLCFRSQEYRPNETIYRMPVFGFRIRIPWYLYFFVSILDVGAGIVMLISLQYTSLTSVTLLGSLTVPSTMLFSKILLGKSFYVHHILGVVLCVIGGCLTIWSDLDTKKDGVANDNDVDVNAPHRPWGVSIGDLLATTAALLYGLGDAVSEYSIKHIDRMEFLGMLGFFGMILTGLQFPFQEMDVLSRLFEDPASHRSALGLMVGYISLLLLYYVTEASFLVSSDATLLNLSLQAQNLWAILFTVLANHAAPPALFYLALVLVIVGVFVYEVGPSSDPFLLSGQPTSAPVSLPADGTASTTEEENRSVVEDGGIQPPRISRGQYSSVEQIEII